MEHNCYEKYLINYGYKIDKSGICFNRKGIKVNGSKNKSGYILIGARINGKIAKVPIHRMQAYQKFGENMYIDGIEVRHLNGISTDNSYKNIEIGTHSENMMDQSKEARKTKASNANKKYSDKLILEMKTDSINKISYNGIMKKYGISSKGTLSYILNKRIV